MLFAIGIGCGCVEFGMVDGLGVVVGRRRWGCSICWGKPSATMASNDGDIVVIWRDSNAFATDCALHSGCRCSLRRSYR